MIRNRLSALALFAPLVTIGLVASAQAADSCQPVFDALTKLITTPSHSYTTSTAVNGGRPTDGETIVTGSPGARGENTAAYSVAYERYQPGLSDKTITSLTQGKIVCQ